MRDRSISRACLACLLVLSVLSHTALARGISQQEFEILREANELATSGQYDAAEASVRDLLATSGISDAGRETALNTLGFVLYQKDDIPGALETYKQLLNQAGVGRELRSQTAYTIAQLSSVSDDHEAALEYLTEYLEEAAPTPANYVFLAQTYYSLDRYADMITPLEKGIALAEETRTPTKEAWWTLLLFAGREARDPAMVARANDALLEHWPSEKRAANAVKSQLLVRDLEYTDAAMRRYVDRYPDGELITPMHLATMKADSASIRALVGRGEAIDGPGGLDRTPLQLAAYFSLATIVELLLELGADTEVQSSGGAAAIMYAALAGDADIVRTLWEAGADITHRAGETSVMQLMGMEGHAELVSEILDAHPHLVDEEGGKALSLAAGRGHAPVVQLLLERGVSLLYRSEGGPTALQNAAASGDLETVAAILKAGANPDETYDDRQAPLAIAARRGHADVAQALIESDADVNALNSANRGPLFFAAQNGHVDIVALLLEKGATADQVDTFGDTPLLAAASANAWSAFQSLADAGADISRQYSNGATVLAVAAGDGENDIVSMLLDAGADPNGGDPDQSPLRFAISGNQAATVTLLVEAGADTLGEAYKASNALYFAAVAEYPEVVAALQDSGAVALEPASFLEGWKMKDVAKFLKGKQFKRTGRGAVEHWTSGDGRQVELHKQDAPYSIADIVRLAAQSGIEVFDWIEAGRK